MRNVRIVTTTITFILLLSLVMFTQRASADFGGWIARYDGHSRLDAPSGLVADSIGNVYVTGYTRVLDTNYDYVTIKYDANGNELWVAQYDGPIGDSDMASAIAVDEAGNVYVTGRSKGPGGGNGIDIATIKYDANGNQLWVARYEGPADHDDVSYGIAVDSVGSVFVVGTTAQSGTETDFVIIKYDTNGSALWTSMYDGPWHTSMALDVDGYDNVYVVGTIHSDFATMKYDSNGNQLWIAIYDGPGGYYDEATQMTLDGSGNVYVAGESHNDGSSGNSDFATIKYDTNGNELWVARYNNAKDGSDYVKALGVDAQGNVYVAGESRESIDETREVWPATTIKYDANGNQIWMVRTPPSDMHIRNGTVDSAGNVYIIGMGIGANFERWVTRKYDTNGSEVWTKLFNGDYNSIPLIFVDSEGNVCVTGYHQSDLITISISSAGESSFAVDFSGTPTNGESPLAVTFSDLTVGSADSWQWDFNYDGKVDSSVQNPSFTYNAPGTYSVFLQVSGPEGRAFFVKENYISSGGPVINKIKHFRCVRGETIVVQGTGFGDTQGDSLVHIGKKFVYDSTSPLIKIWSDTKIRFKMKQKNRWFERMNGEKVKVWVTIGGADSNIKPIRPYGP